MPKPQEEDNLIELDILGRIRISIHRHTGEVVLQSPSPFGVLNFSWSRERATQIGVGLIRAAGTLLPEPEAPTESEAPTETEKR